MGSLTRGEQKSLALHRALAVKVRTNPSLLAVARRRLEWLRGRNPAGAAYYDEWARLLDGPLETFLDVMVSPSVHAFVRALLDAAVLDPGLLVERLRMVTAPDPVVTLAMERLTAYGETRRGRR